MYFLSVNAIARSKMLMLDYKQTTLRSFECEYLQGCYSGQVVVMMLINLIYQQPPF